jgi:hypothetical protein
VIVVVATAAAVDVRSRHKWCHAGRVPKGTVALAIIASGQAGLMCRRPPRVSASAFAGFWFPPEVITLVVRWYLRFALSYRDVEELLAERGIEVDHVTMYRWVQRFTPLLSMPRNPAAHSRGSLVRGRNVVRHEAPCCIPSHAST